MREYIPVHLFPVILILTLIFTPALQARIISVPDDSTSIQSAIDGTSNGDTVRVSPGTYDEFAIDFHGKAITVTGTNPQDSMVVESTVVNGNYLGTVFLFHTGEDSGSVLTGLTITGGMAANGAGIRCGGASPTIALNHVRGNISTNNGGGIYCGGASPIIHGNIVDGNTATNAGGGLYYTNSSGRLSNNKISDNASNDIGGGISCYQSDPSITDNMITGNSTVELGGGIHCSLSSPVISNNYIHDNSTDVNGGGGGIYCYSSSPDIADNIITGNWAGVWGGGIYCFVNASPLISENIITENSANYFGGGGICCIDASPTITNNTITGNSADDSSGGGISCYDSSPAIHNNSIVGNRADHWGGGIFCWNTVSPIITNNIIKNNTALDVGGGISCYHATAPVVTNNTIFKNTAGDGGGGISCSDSSFVTVKNTIFWDNDAPDGPEIYIYLYDKSSVVTISYSDVEGGEGETSVDPGCILNWGAGMIDVDPLFFDDELRLDILSPCVDTGHPANTDNCRPPGQGSDRSDIGAFGGEGNCWWPELGVDLIFYLPNSLVLHKRENLIFGSFILNNTPSNASGDYWISVLLPNQNELVIPANFSNYINPLSGQVPAFRSIFLNQRINIPAQAVTGSYSMIGRIGHFPTFFLDEEIFGFQIIE